MTTKKTQKQTANRAKRDGQAQERCDAAAIPPRRIRLSRKRGWRKPPRAVTVARPTYWGNPWRVGVHGDRATCVRAHADWLAGKRHDAPDGRSAGEVLARIGELRGKDLACWCLLDGPCHADALLKLANQGGQ
ncbi:MAG: DUF4326 domain-containing protein [Verrucomicrobiae bacterium]|nr:DUF4326 domain-containing protein [Verrucomicrobiae bacterium]